MAGKKGNGGSRSPYYNKNFAPLAAEMAAALGMRDVDIAQKFGIHVDTLYEWRKRHPEFAEVIDRGKEKPDGAAVAALLKSGLGYFVTEKTTYKDEKGNVTNSIETEKWIKENSTSLIFWLKNRLPRIWRDRQEMSVDFENDPMKIFGEGLAKFRLPDGQDPITD